MIGALRGTLIERDVSGTAIVDVGGVGYLVQMTPTAAVGLGELGSEVDLRIFTRVREDSIALYGFKTADEKRCFEVLIGSHGVGPAMALALLAMHTPRSLRQVVAMEDIAALSQVPGIGKKTAQRLLVELKTRLEVDGDYLESTDAIDLATSSSDRGPRSEVTVALSGLGYGGDEIRQVVARLPAEGSTEELLRHALKELATS
jgi:holliday junction DNA helicase RuvA